MLFSFLVTLREGIEIALVVTILLGYLRNLGQKDHFREVWIGVVAAAALSIGFGAVLEITSKELSGRVLEAFEGFTMLFAVAVLTWMVFWMKRQSAGISRELRHQIDVALSGGSVFALAMLAFSAVAREGFETVLFLFAGSTNAASGFEFWAGGALGFGIAAVAGVVLYYGAARLPLKQFFLVSGVVVIVLAAGLLSNGLTELYHARVIGDLGSHPWDTDSYVPMTSTMGTFLHTVLGYDSAPTMGQIVAYWGYLLIVLGAYLLVPSGKPRATTPQRRLDAETPSARESSIAST
jgi:high-affinity iron transporter